MHSPAAWYSQSDLRIHVFMFCRFVRQISFEINSFDRFIIHMDIHYGYSPPLLLNYSSIYVPVVHVLTISPLKFFFILFFIHFDFFFVLSYLLKIVTFFFFSMHLNSVEFLMFPVKISKGRIRFVRITSLKV